MFWPRRGKPLSTPEEAETQGPLLRRYLPDMVYGANDGIITTFAIVAGVVGANLPTAVVLILGLASLIADGVSMAASNFLAERSRASDRLTRVQAARHAFATFGGFVTMGVAPLIAYLLPVPEAQRFPVAAAATLATLFAVGSARSLAAEHIRWFRGGIEMLLVGAGAAGVAYGIGAGIAYYVGLEGVPI
ncbi:MAG: VIT1/CCC1 transporter family protein [Phycisphaeraceae bacterium]